MEKDYSQVGHPGSTEDRRKKAIEDGIREKFPPEQACEVFNTLLGVYPLTPADQAEIEAYHRKKQVEELNKLRENFSKT